jgi:hypothetical protein
VSLTAFLPPAASGDRSSSLVACGVERRRGVTPFPLVTNSKVTFEGGPWVAWMLTTHPSDWDAVDPPSVPFPDPSGRGRVGEVKVIIDDDQVMYPYTGALMLTGRPFRRIAFVDQRASAFIGLDVNVLLASDPDFFAFFNRYF